MIKRDEIVVSVKVKDCKHAKMDIWNKYQIKLDELDDYDNILIYLRDAEALRIVEKS